MTMDDPIDLPLTEAERRMLRTALFVWDGPAHPTEECAVALGFTSTDDMRELTEQWAAALQEHRPLSKVDWVRALLVFELMFGSDQLGVGYEWQTVTGYSDAETITVLRTLQRKIMARGRVVGVAFGTLIRSDGTIVGPQD